MYIWKFTVLLFSSRKWFLFSKYIFLIVYCWASPVSCSLSVLLNVLTNVRFSKNVVKVVFTWRPTGVGVVHSASARHLPVNLATARTINSAAAPPVHFASRNAKLKILVNKIAQLNYLATLALAGNSLKFLLSWTSIEVINSMTDVLIEMFP